VNKERLHYMNMSWYVSIIMMRSYMLFQLNFGKSFRICLISQRFCSYSRFVTDASFETGF